MLQRPRGKEGLALEVTSASRGSTCRLVPWARGVLLSHPLDHVEVASFGRGTADLLVPGTAVLPRPAYPRDRLDEFFRVEPNVLPRVSLDLDQRARARRST